MTEVPRKPLSTRLPSSIPSINVAQPTILGSKLLQPSKIAPPLISNVPANNTNVIATSVPKLAPLKPLATMTAIPSIASTATSTSTSKLLTRSAIPSALPSFKPNSIASSIPTQAPVASAIPSFITRAESIPSSVSESTPVVSPAPSPIVSAIPAPTVVLPTLTEVEDKREDVSATTASLIPLPSELIESKVEESEEKKNQKELLEDDEYDEDEEAARREEEDGFGKFTIPEHDPSDFDSMTSMRSITANTGSTSSSSSSSSSSSLALAVSTDVKPVFQMEVEENETTIARREQAIESAAIHQHKLQEEICLYSTKLANIMALCEESNLYSSSEFIRNLLHQIRNSEGVKFDLSEVE